MLKLLVLFVLLAILQVNSKLCKSSCTVKLKSGEIKGNCKHKFYDAYTGIPYAKPPIGDLRFEPPQPIEPWENQLKATKDVIKCTQFHNSNATTHTGSEDCLYMYVYVSKVKSKDCMVKRDFMVILWLHSGSFQFGSPLNKPQLLMQSGNTIVVSAGYRQGPLGFLSTNDNVMPGNNGLKDQRLAIKWVEQNIAAFGGNTKKIVLFGDWKGASAVELHMITGSGKRIAAYGSLSGSAFNPWAFSTKPTTAAQDLAKLLDCPFKHENDEFKKCMKAKPIEDIQRATASMYKFGPFSIALFRPNVESETSENAFLTKSLEKAIETGSTKNKPFLVGIVEGEGAFMPSNLMQLNGAHRSIFDDLNTRWYEVCPIIFFYESETPENQYKLCKDLKTKYMCDRKFSIETHTLLERMFADSYYHDGIDESVQLHRKSGRKVYRYIAEIPTRYNAGNKKAQEILDYCGALKFKEDGPGVLAQVSVLRNIAKLIKSLVNRQRPKYINLNVPANINNNKPDKCLHIKYESQQIEKCDFGPINCEQSFDCFEQFWKPT